MKLLPLILLTVLCTTIYGQDSTSIYFSNGSHQLSTKSTSLLDSLVYHNVITPYHKYSIIGYADNTGGEQTNIQLSINRANAVFVYLSNLGIDSNNINVLVGNGAIGAANIQNDANRRVDIVVDTGEIAPSKVVDLSKVTVGGKIKLDNLFFIGGMATLQKSSMPTLEALLKAMQDNPKLVIRLEGHVHYQKLKYYVPSNAFSYRNSQLNDDDMQRLSEDRAKAVYDYLLKNGISANRISYKGFSYSRLYESPKNNRRVEARILAK